MKRVLITGGAGFIGSNFVRYLFNKYPDYKITVLDAITYAGNLENFSEEMNKDSRFTLWHGNVRNADLVGTLVAQSDIVVHFAAETHVTRSVYDNFSFIETDVVGTQTIANAVSRYRDTVERFIHISSSEVYGTALTPVMDEDHPLNPMSPYAAAKAGADRLVYSYWATYDIPAVIVRPFNTFGPYQHLEKVIPRFITSCILNEPLTVHGDGASRRDWLYVDDLCVALDRIMQSDIKMLKGQAINIGSGRDLSILEIAHLVVGKMKKSPSLITCVGDRPGQVERHTASIEKARTLLEWEAKISFEEGLERAISWYQTHPDWWKRQLWMRRVPIITKQGKHEFH